MLRGATADDAAANEDPFPVNEGRDAITDGASVGWRQPRGIFQHRRQRFLYPPWWPLARRAALRFIG